MVEGCHGWSIEEESHAKDMKGFLLGVQTARQHNTNDRWSETRASFHRDRPSGHVLRRNDNENDERVMRDGVN